MPLLPWVHMYAVVHRLCLEEYTREKGEAESGRGNERTRVVRRLCYILYEFYFYHV